MCDVNDVEELHFFSVKLQSRVVRLKARELRVCKCVTKRPVARKARALCSRLAKLLTRENGGMSPQVVCSGCNGSTRTQTRSMCAHAHADHRRRRRQLGARTDLLSPPPPPPPLCVAKLCTRASAFVCVAERAANESMRARATRTQQSSDVVDNETHNNLCEFVCVVQVAPTCSAHTNSNNE